MTTIQDRRRAENSATTFATELANADVSVYTLMTLLGHESMVTSQRYVTAAGTETRTAAAQNKLYSLLAEDR
jgi:integrase